MSEGGGDLATHNTCVNATQIAREGHIPRRIEENDALKKLMTLFLDHAGRAGGSPPPQARWSFRARTAADCDGRYSATSSL